MFIADVYNRSAGLLNPSAIGRCHQIPPYRPQMRSKAPQAAAPATLWLSGTFTTWSTAPSATESFVRMTVVDGTKDALTGVNHAQPFTPPRARVQSIWPVSSCAAPSDVWTGTLTANAGSTQKC
jgi:hypothetical protein